MNTGISPRQCLLISVLDSTRRVVVHGVDAWARSKDRNRNITSEPPRGKNDGCSTTPGGSTYIRLHALGGHSSSKSAVMSGRRVQIATRVGPISSTAAQGCLSAGFATGFLCREGRLVGVGRKKEQNKRDAEFLDSPNTKKK